MNYILLNPPSREDFVAQAKNVISGFSFACTKLDLVREMPIGKGCLIRVFFNLNYTHLSPSSG
jgi:hypothetical protein